MLFPGALIRAQGPVFEWAKGMGGAGSDQGTSITLDAAGNVFTTGFFNGTSDFDPGPGTFNLISAGLGDVFISKLDASGNFVWAKQFEGTGDDQARTIGIDASGNVLLTGIFTGTCDFDPGVATFNLTAAGSNDIFISKLNPSGNLLWAKQLGGTGGDESNDLVIDATGNVLTTGYFANTVDFDPGGGIFNLSSAGVQDIYISKLDASGNFIWAKIIGAAGSDIGRSITTDPTGNVFTTGIFSGTVDFDPGAGTFDLIANASFQGFISKLDAAGNLVWVKQFGSRANAVDIAFDAAGNLFTQGAFDVAGDYDPGPGVFNLSPSGSYATFILKLDPAGNFVWATKMTGAPYSFTWSMALDASSNVYVAGLFQGTFLGLTATGTYSIFIHRIHASGTSAWTSTVPGPSYAVGRSIVVNSTVI